MDPELEGALPGAEVEAPVVDNGPSLDDSLNAAFDRLATPETDAEKAERLRDEQGRFAAKPEGEPAKDPAKLEAEAPKAPAAAEMPASWSRRAEMFAKAPPELQAAIAEREAEMARGVERFKGLAEYADMAEKNGLPLATVMASYIEAEKFLAQDFVGGVRHICQQFGVDPAQLASVLGGGPAVSGAAPQGVTQPAPAPAIPNEIMDRLAGFESSLSSIREQNALTEIQRFAADPANKHFEEVAQDITRLIRGARQAGDNLSLAEAYNAAIYANPTVRAKVEAERKAAEDAERIATARAAATTARRAGKSLAPSGTGTPSAPVRASLDEQLNDAWDRLSA
jgi:hypothetical protein